MSNLLNDFNHSTLTLCFMMIAQKLKLGPLWESVWPVMHDMISHWPDLIYFQGRLCCIQHIWCNLPWEYTELPK